MEDKAMVNGTHEEQLLKKLAAAMSANPRGNTQTLAEMAGISRATFNRFCGSRENLVEMIINQAEIFFEEIIDLAQNVNSDYEKVLSKLIEVHFCYEEYLVFCCGTQNIFENKYWDSYISALDGFFLQGQKAGVFRLEMSSQMLTELLISMICGMIDAEHRNRVASAGIVERMAKFFMEGAGS
jgi:TetR/AcrR family transcriptional repressor of mexCD-oprJ operon